MNTELPIFYVRERPQILCPFYKNSLAVFEIAMRYFTDSYLAACSKSLLIDYKDNTVRFRDFGKSIPFEEMHGDKMDDFKRWNGEFRGLSGWNPIVPMTLMGICKEMELTSFHNGKKLTSRSVDDARCGAVSNTEEADGVEIRLVHDKVFEPAYINGMISTFRSFFPDMEICVNGKKLLKSNGLADILYQKLTPSRILEPLIDYRSEDLDFTAALDIYPRVEPGPCIFSYLNTFETYEGGEHYDAVLNALGKIVFPFKKERLCIAFHCKAKECEMIFMSMLKNKAHFNLKSAKDFEKRIEALLKKIKYPTKENVCGIVK